jgi:phosphomannomutase
MAHSSHRQLRISHVGLRGIVGQGLAASHVLDFAAAFGTMLDAGPIVIGRDPRSSGLMIREGVVAALLATGHDVIDLGIVSTPVIQHAIQRGDAAGGISIGASHNSAEWNALKFFGARGTYLSTAEAGELLDIYHLRKFRFTDHTQLGQLYHNATALERYLDELASVFDLKALSKFKVVVDCCNGTSSIILRRMIERFGLHFILINEKIQGVSFAHEPSINAETVSLQLAPLIQPLKADAGFLFDIDSDRVAIACEDGSSVSEELVLPMIADYLLPKCSGKLVITNLSTTALVDEVASRHGGRVLRAAVGRQASMDALASYRPEQIAVAGEGTGAIMMPQFRFIYDGIASMLAVLTHMMERGAKLSEIVSSYPPYSIIKGEVQLVSQQVPLLLMNLQKQYSDGIADQRDGLRVSWPDRWFHVRVSQTEPIVRVICEEKGGPPTELFDSLMEQVRSMA